jgi:hypothetical protein
MSERDWLPSPPVGVGLGVLLLLAVAGLADQYQQAQHSEYAATQKYEETKQVVPLGAAPQRPYTDPKSYRDEWRAESDLEAQRKAADWTKWGVLATGAGIYFVVVTLWYTRKGVSAAFRAAEHARVAADIARRTYLAEHRAWLKITPFNASAIFRGNTMNVSITLRIENVGRSPAIEVVPYAKPFRARRYVVAGTGLEGVMEFQRKIYGTLALPALVLMPGDPGEVGFSADAETDPATEAKIAQAGGGDFFDVPENLSVAVVVFYKSTSSDDVRHTALVLMLSKIDGTEFLPELGNVLPENIRVRSLVSETKIT